MKANSDSSKADFQRIHNIHPLPPLIQNGNKNSEESFVRFGYHADKTQDFSTKKSKVDTSIRYS